MEVWQNLPILVTLLLVVAAALVTGDTEARREVVSYFAEALKPRTADLRTTLGRSTRIFRAIPSSSRAE
jgi:hypothetical protein